MVISLFLRQNLIRKGDSMLNDHVLEKILINDEIIAYSVSEQSRIIGIFESIIIEICKEDEYADVSKLLSK